MSTSAICSIDYCKSLSLQNPLHSILKPRVIRKIVDYSQTLIFKDILTLWIRIIWVWAALIQWIRDSNPVSRDSDPVSHGLYPVSHGCDPSSRISSQWGWILSRHGQHLSQWAKNPSQNWLWVSAHKWRLMAGSDLRITCFMNTKLGFWLKM